MNSYGYEDLMSSMENFVEEHASLILTILGVSIILCVLMIISLWKIFTKSGEKGWKALIPFYNILTLMKIIDMSWWFIILMFIPFVQLFFYALLSVMLANRFGKGVIFAIGILFLPCIFIPILAFTKTELVEYEEDDVEDDEEEDCIYCPNCNTKLGKDAKICFVCKTEIGKKTKDEKIEDEIKEEEKEIIDTNEDIKDVKEEEKEVIENNSFDIEDEQLDTKEDFKEENELDLDNILKEIDKETENLQEEMDTTLEDEKEDIDSTSKEEEKDEKTIDEILKVDKEEETKSYKEKKFKSSTKTLDDILKINQNLYSDSKKEEKNKDDSVEDIEILDLEPEEIEKKPKKKESDIKLCPSCGSKVPSYSTYCIFCGEEVK